MSSAVATVPGTKEQIVARWRNLKTSMARAERVIVETTQKAGVSALAFAGTMGTRYWWQRRKLAGKSNYVDKANKVNGFFWGGVVLAAAGVTPFTGAAGPYLAALGTGVATGGGIDAVDKLAAEHHAAAQKP